MRVGSGAVMARVVARLRTCTTLRKVVRSNGDSGDGGAGASLERSDGDSDGAGADADGAGGSLEHEPSLAHVFGKMTRSSAWT